MCAFTAAMSALALFAASVKCPDSIQNGFECARYREATLLRQMDGKAQRLGGRLVFRQVDGNWLAVTDEMSPETNGIESALYSLLVYNESEQIAVVGGHFYEGTSSQLLNLVTGRRYIVHGEPVWSPSGQTLATYSEGIEYANMTRTGLWLYRVENGVPYQLASFESAQWGPTSLRWLSETEAELTCIAVDGARTYESTGRLLKNSHGWSVSCGSRHVE